MSSQGPLRAPGPLPAGGRAAAFRGPGGVPVVVMRARGPGGQIDAEQLIGHIMSALGGQPDSRDVRRAIFGTHMGTPMGRPPGEPTDHE